jgi:cellobiose phosphorylase
VVLGAGGSEEEAHRLAESYGDASRARAAVEETIAQWQRRLAVIRVRTP